MRLDDAARDAQPQAGMQAERLAPRALAVKAVEYRLRGAGRQAGAVVLDRRRDLAAARLEADADGPAGRAERDRVVDQVEENLRQPVLDSAHPGVGAGRRPQDDLRPAAGGLAAFDRDHRLQQPRHVDRREGGPREFGVEPRRGRNVGDQPVHPGDVLRQDLAQAPPRRRVLHPDEGVDGGLQARQRVLELVRHVGGEALDLVDAGAQLAGHPAQRDGQIADLVAAPAHVGDLAGAAPLRRHLLRRGREPADRPRHRPRQIERKQRGDGEDGEAQQQHVAAGLAHLGLDPRRVGRQQQGAQNLLEAAHRRRDSEADAAVRHAPRLGADLAVERGHDLGEILRARVVPLHSARQVAHRQAVEERFEAARQRPRRLGRRQRADGDAGAGPRGPAAVHQQLAVIAEHPRPGADRQRERRDQPPREIGVDAPRRRRVARDRRLAEHRGDDPRLRRQRVEAALDQPALVLVEIDHAADEDAAGHQVDRQHPLRQRREPPPRPSGLTLRRSGSRRHTGSRSGRSPGRRRGTSASSA